MVEPADPQDIKALAAILAAIETCDQDGHTTEAKYERIREFARQHQG